MNSPIDLPELHNTRVNLVRIPAEIDVPVTNRVQAILNTSAFQRLKRVSQLGLVAHVYPGATHSRFEHSLGVYRLAREVLLRLLDVEPDFAAAVTAEEAKIFLLAALLHDVGHWPYCHPIEDMRLAWVPTHERLARELICGQELSAVISNEWKIAPDCVANFLEPLAHGECSQAERTLRNVLNGPVDIDKMDYLQRDSLHSGVPYGRNFDESRLIAALCVGDDGSSLAITSKGKTAAEMMVFARYVMFSEVYWHHTVRSATAMLQRLVFELSRQCDPLRWLQSSDLEFQQELCGLAAARPELLQLASALFDGRRALFKRNVQFSFTDNPAAHAALAGRPYEQLVQVSEVLASKLASQIGRPIHSTEVLIDAPPVKLEVQFQMLVRVANENPTDPPSNGPGRFVPLASISPVVQSLATEQFDNYVKRVRVFVAPGLAAELAPRQPEMLDLLLAASEDL